MGFISFVSRNIEILSNSFRIYFTNFSKILLISAILNVLFFAIRELLGYILSPDTVISNIIVLWLTIFNFVLAYGAIVVATILVMDNRRINILFCFQVVWYRILTLILISTIYTGLLGILLGVLQLVTNSTMLIVGVLAYLIAFVFILNYFISVVEVNILEQYRGINVFKRAIVLVQGQWLEAFGFNFLRVLAWFGFSFAITLIIVLLITQIFPVINLSTRAIDSNIQIELKLLQLIVAILTQPLLYIAGVVWYHQTRLTRENVDVRTILTGKVEH